jgi:WD40 repeat protein
MKHLIHSQDDEILLLKAKDNFKHKGGVNVLLWESIDGCSMLFSGGVDSTIKLWNLEADVKYSDNYVKTILGHTGSIISLAYCRSRSILVSSSIDSTIKIWKIDENFDKILNPLFHCINTLKVMF